MVFPVLGAASLALSVFGVFSGISQANKQARMQRAQIEAQTAMSAMTFASTKAFIGAQKQMRVGEHAVFKLLISGQEDIASRKHDLSLNALKVSRTLFDIKEMYQLNLNLDKASEQTLSYANRGLSLSTSMQVYAKHANKLHFEYNMQKLDKDIELQFKRIDLMLNKGSQDLHFVEKRHEMSNNIAKQELSDIQRLMGANMQQGQSRVNAAGDRARVNANQRANNMDTIFTGIKAGIEMGYDYKHSKGLFG